MFLAFFYLQSSKEPQDSHSNNRVKFQFYFYWEIAGDASVLLLLLGSPNGTVENRLHARLRMLAQLDRDALASFMVTTESSAQNNWYYFPKQAGWVPTCFQSQAHCPITSSCLLLVNMSFPVNKPNCTFPFGSFPVGTFGVHSWRWAWETAPALPGFLSLDYWRAEVRFSSSFISSVYCLFFALVILYTRDIRKDSLED